MSNETQTSPLPLNPMHLPEPPSWLPLSWGWWAVITSILLTTLIIFMFIRWRKKRLAPKRTALRLLACGNQPSEAIELVRQAALCYFPREQIAQLTGKEWYSFLDSQLATPRFSDNYDLWQQALYTNQAVPNAEQLIQHCNEWVEQALPPKKGRISRG
ncbi:hypothetical protein VIOR3934_00535 [Vibrio orientalis CIP 102891 = ATCC 33934]|uniref:DUF4381 domain-containing protein n=1 Tax=Vibrio orientalis CIP 102891 = ATCC 33934 TaxID=675816 RepID=C9QHI4_VIBOR|nr:DUF4381 domain-containing protein [Vibrio orientalis]EEX93715.1 hypothetical protein VIA_000872 [Vibrio orientalis CIP 102891 = ATCC 33934]EGU51110.1 hypothetical protein VIOR3934_00535 [Vibrio orientalis CIP 102891 = ATCC 33934]